METLVHRRLLIWLLAVLSAACVPAAPAPTASPETFKGPPLIELEAQPALALTMPQAREVAITRHDRENTFEGPYGAWSGRIFDTQATMDEVFAYYDSRLSSLGWVKDFPPIRTSQEATTRGWCKPGMVFRIGIYSAQPIPPVAIPEGMLRFDARIQGTDVRCPQV